MTQQASAGGRYRPMTSYETSKVVAGLYGGSVVCEDCGAVVVDEKAHDRSHAIQSDVGRTVAILTVAHLSPSVHDRYEAYDKIWKGRNRNHWSDEAFTEVTGLPAQNEGVGHD